MENKKNYVDGVDVSECEHYRAEIETKMPYGEYETQKDKCYYSGIEVIQDCKGVKGCIYKQLKRLEQENKQLKKSIDRIMQNKEIKTIDLDIAKENVELKAENERLKEEINRNGREWENHCNALYWQMQSIIDKYKQALQEIKEDLETQSYCECSECGNDEYDKCIECMTKRYLAKINEVIGAE